MINEKQHTLRNVSLVSLAGLTILLIGSLVFYRERVLFIDAAFILFSVINRGALLIQENRFGSFITQIVPLICSKLHVPIKGILVAYSASFNAFYLSVAATLVFWFRQYALAVIMGFYYLLFASESYFWTNNEIHQAVAWMFLFYGAVLHMGHRKTHAFFFLPVFIVLATLAAFTHIMVMPPMLFLWVFLALDKNVWPFSKKQTIIYTLLLAAIVAFKIILSSYQPYDGGKMHDATHFSIQDILDGLASDFSLRFLQRCIADYWIMLVPLVWGIVAMIQQKRYRSLLCTLLFAFGYYAVMCLVFGTYKFMFLFYEESEWMGLAVIITAPFAFYALPGFKSKPAVALVALILMVRLGYVAASAPKFAARIAMQENMLRKMRDKHITRLLLETDEAVHDRLIDDWAIGEESLMLSACNGDHPQYTIFTRKEQHITEEALNNKNILITRFAHWELRDLNRYYFMPDTTQAYQALTYEQLMN